MVHVAGCSMDGLSVMKGSFFNPHDGRNAGCSYIKPKWGQKPEQNDKKRFPTRIHHKATKTQRKARKHEMKGVINAEDAEKKGSMEKQYERSGKGNPV